MSSPARFRKVIEEAKLARTRGNEHFGAGNYREALKEYYTVLLSLRGLDGSIGQAFPAAAALQEVDDEEEEAEGDVREDRESLQKEIKACLAATMSNMSACHLKQQNWQKALKFSTDALALDAGNRKAKFREAQARIGLGETVKGRRMLQELDAAEGDASIRAAIKSLDLAEEQRSKKAKDQFRGFLNKQAAAEKQASGIDFKGPKIQEIVDDETEPGQVNGVVSAV